MRMLRGMRLASVLVLVACGPKPPPVEVSPPRLAAEEACTGVDLVATPLPVPPRGAPDPSRWSPTGILYAREGGAMVRVTHVCDLPTHVLAIAAEQSVESGRRKIGGRAWSLGRGATAPAIPAMTIDPDSPGCRQGEITCRWQTSSPAVSGIDTLASQRVPTSGWVHGADDMCRALPDDAIAFCSTATRMAYVELGCNATDAPPVALQLGIHDTSLPRAFDLDVEVPVARLHGAADAADGDSFRYTFRGDGRTATLAIELTTPRATLTVDGVAEDCVAFGIDRR